MTQALIFAGADASSRREFLWWLARMQDSARCEPAPTSECGLAQALRHRQGVPDVL